MPISCFSTLWVCVPFLSHVCWNFCPQTNSYLLKFPTTNLRFQLSQQLLPCIQPNICIFVPKLLLLTANFCQRVSIINSAWKKRHFRWIVGFSCDINLKYESTNFDCLFVWYNFGFFVDIFLDIEYVCASWFLSILLAVMI